MKTLEQPNSLKGWKGILIFIIPYLIIVGIFQIIGYSIAGIDMALLAGDVPYKESSKQLTIIQFFDLIGTILLVWFFTKIIYKESFVDLGFAIKNREKDILIGFLIGLLTMGTTFLLLFSLGGIKYESMTFEPTEVIYVLLIFILVAFSEEILCRGFILGNLMTSFNKYAALIISSLIFSLLHYFNPHINFISIFNLFLAGIVLGLPYIYTQNLWLPISLHFSWNFFQAMFGFHVSGIGLYSVINISIPEENLLNGGSFGFEGSLTCSIFLLLIVVALVTYYKRNSDKKVNKYLVPTNLISTKSM